MEIRLENFRKSRGYMEKRAIVWAMEISMDVHNFEKGQEDVIAEAVFAREFYRDVCSNPHVLQFGDGALAEKDITSDVCTLERVAANQNEWVLLQKSALCHDLLGQLPVDIVSNQIRIMLEIEERILPSNISSGEIYNK
jgi:hypothetical protein